MRIHRALLWIHKTFHEYSGLFCCSVCCSVCCCAIVVGFFADTQGSFADTQGSFAGTQGSLLDAPGGKTAVSRYRLKIHWVWENLRIALLTPIHRQIK